MCSPTFDACVLFDDSHSDRCEVLFHWDLHFPDISNVEHPFMFGHVSLMLLGLLICKMVTVLGPISVSSWAWKETVHEGYLAQRLAPEKEEVGVTIIEKRQQLIWSQTSGLQSWFWHWITTWPWPLASALWETGFPGGPSGTACQCRRRKRCRFDPWVSKVPWRRPWQPTPVFLPEESHGQGTLAGYSPRGSQRVGHDWATEYTHTHTHTQLLTKVFGAFEAKIMSSAQVIESGC